MATVTDTIQQKLTSIVSRLPGKEAFEAVVAAANGGDEQALNELEHILQQHDSVWNTVSSLGEHAMAALVDLLSNGDPLVIARLEEGCQLLHSELLGIDRPTKLEQLVISRVICAWLEYQMAMIHTSGLGQESLVKSRFHLKMRESADRRFDNAVRALQCYRKREAELKRVAC